MKTTCLRHIALATLALSLLGCSGHPIKIPNTTDHAVDKSRGRPISAEAGGFQLFLFIPININSRQLRAYEALKRQAGNDFISDVKVRESWYWAMVGTIHWTQLQAMAYPKLSESSP